MRTLPPSDWLVQARHDASRLFEEGSGNKEARVKGTLWAAYNGITEFVDYARGGRDPDRHLDSIWFGGGYLTKARAYRIAVDKAAGWKN